MDITDNMCYVDTSAPDIITTTNSLMTYKNNGIGYNHSFTVSKAGPISIFIYANESRTIKGIYYLNTNFADPPYSENWTDFTLPWAANPQLAGGQTAYFSYKFDTYIKGPITGTVNFVIRHDDGIEIIIDGTPQQFLTSRGSILVYQNLDYIGRFTASFSYQMTLDQLYRFQIKWANRGAGHDEFEWYWDYTGQSRIIIPSTSYYYPNYLGPSVINSLCPTGYSPNASYDCAEI